MGSAIFRTLFFEGEHTTLSSGLSSIVQLNMASIYHAVPNNSAVNKNRPSSHMALLDKIRYKFFWNNHAGPIVNSQIQGPLQVKLLLGQTLNEFVREPWWIL